MSKKCQSCHRPGQAGPFSLETYEQVYQRREMIRFVLEKNIMPPWSFNGDSTQFVGRVDGNITTMQMGDGGFGYDPIFMPAGHDRTFAQMKNEEKNSMSHRARALEQFLEFLSK